MVSIMADSTEYPSKKKWSTEAMGTPAQTEQKITPESLDDIAVILIQGDNMFGDQVYSYVKFTLKDFRGMRDAMTAGENFKPSDYGEVIAAGRGEPPQELKDEMRVQYGLVDTPKPENQGEKPIGMDKPQLFDEDDGF